MAICYTRLLCQRNLGLTSLRCLYTSNPISVSATNSLCATTRVCETHDERNLRLKRPLSPHLTIYQPQLTSMLSITHRATGIALSSYAIIFGFSALLLPGGVPCLIESIQALCLPGPILFVGKALVAFPATFHYFNGIRHLIWDLGKCLTIKEVYTTGYIVMALGAITAVALAAL
ncbi:succinate dehydrogenase cytochrome b560 subunit, mitochondrial [Cephus cinctus]|uniref:Succinate dehydrogenase cytochrome b560 subunit, mitochondrial n=1 Tax=Cephus cinctus TaxID=211228 RepID=A0AAJ7FV85_CEPCN|nr:succinate dehydrogenase cytochrome b560 subunit, mitochondrial [Cephus cinctus]